MEESGLSKTIKSSRSKSISQPNPSNQPANIPSSTVVPSGDTLSTSLGKVPNDFPPVISNASTTSARRPSNASSLTPTTPTGKKQSNVSKNIADGGAGGGKQQTKRSSATSPPSRTIYSPSFFGHLPEYERQSTSSLMRKTRESDVIYSPVMSIAVSMAQGRISGSAERCVAMLECFKEIITKMYSGLPEQAISRHMEAFLRPQINYLVSARPLSVCMSHAIRHLKLVISQLPPETAEDEAKETVCKAIDVFLRNRIELAGKLIVETAMQKIASEGEVILTFGFSALVNSLLLAAKASSKHFRVIVVKDSNDLDGGVQLARDLAKANLECTIIPLSSIGFVLKEATKVIVGAHCIFSNGSLLGRVGTAVIGLLASQHNLPVMVLAETLKFTERVQLDAFVHNELADPSPMIRAAQAANARASEYGEVKACSLVYDVMPADCITMIVCELGMIPVTSVPVVLREHPY